MMKLKKVMIIIMAVLMILTTFPKDIVSIAKSESINSHNKAILEKVKTLQEKAKTYVKWKDSNIDPDKIDEEAVKVCLQYIRQYRYNDKYWNMLLGNLDNGFLTYLGDEETKLRFESEVILDPNTGKEIDFVHMIAPLNAYLKNGDKVMYIVSTDYAGWAGDLITLLEEVTKYRIENNIEDVEELQEYCNSLLGTNKPSSCSSSDILADLDAISLYKDSSNKITEDLYNALYKYYVSKDSTYNANNRLSSTQTILGTKENVKNKAKGLLKNTSFGAIDIKSSLFTDSTMATQVTPNDIEVVSQSFANYVYGEPYLKLEEISGNKTVGQEIKIKIIESNANLKNENIEIEDPTVASAIIEGEYLIIKPLNSGITKITIKTQDNKTSTIYTLTSSNVAPKITKDLEDIYELKENLKRKLLVEAEGTNNEYTWYIGENESGEFSEISDQKESFYEFAPTIDMNNKFIKCGVKNKGNDEIFSNIAKLVVEASEKEEENSTEDNNQVDENITEEDNKIDENVIIDDNITEEEDENININQDGSYDEDDNQKGNDKKEEESIDDKKPTVLPYAGNDNKILIIIPVLLVVAIITYIKTRVYKGI